MNTPHYEAVRNAIIKAVPDILELKFGCYLFETLTGKNVMFIGETKDRKGKRQFYVVRGRTAYYIYPEQALDILGRHIRLADVLLAGGYELRCGGQGDFYFWNGNSNVMNWEKGPKWDLGNDDLSLQSEQFIEFLYKIFYEK